MIAPDTARRLGAHLATRRDFTLAEATSPGVHVARIGIEALALAALGETPYLYPIIDGGVSVETDPVDVICEPDGGSHRVTLELR